MAVHERVWERTESRRPGPLPEWKPVGTYGLLAAIGAVFLLQTVTLLTSVRTYEYAFIIDTDWLLRPWTLVTSTLSHLDLWHLLINGMVLYFFGPHVERLLGKKRFLIAFFVSGAVAGVLQVHLAAVYDAFLSDTSVTAALTPWMDTPSDGALGASGAILFLFGFLMILMPNQTILVMFVIPMPFWVAGVLFAFLDVIGAINPGGTVGNFAHLSGMGLGIWYGLRFKQEMRARGMRLVH